MDQKAGLVPGLLSEGDADIGFARYTWLSLKCSFSDFPLLRDIKIGMTGAALTLGFSVWAHLIPIAEWQQHKKAWILSIVVPNVVMLGGDVLVKVFKSPWLFFRKKIAERSESFRKHQETLQNRIGAMIASHEIQINNAKRENESLHSQLAEALEEKKHSTSLDWGGEWKLAEDAFRFHYKADANAQYQYESLTKTVTWRLQGYTVTITDIEAACCKAGALLLVCPGFNDVISEEVRSIENDWQRWLQYLKEKHPLSNVSTLTSESSDGGTAWMQIGMIRHLPALSASECIKCAAIALGFKHLW